MTLLTPHENDSKAISKLIYEFDSCYVAYRHIYTVAQNQNYQMAHEAIFVKVAQGASRKTKVDDLLIKCKNSLKNTFQSESFSLGIRNPFFSKVCFSKIVSVFGV